MNIQDYQKYLDEANKENAAGTHRGIVLVWSSIIDDMLYKMLSAHFIELNKDLTDRTFGPNGPAGSFSNRTRLCFALGLIKKDEMKVIDMVRDIRNDFAHEISIDLNNAPLADKCRKLGHLFDHHQSKTYDPRLSFAGACGSLLGLLSNRLALIKRSEAINDDRELPYRPYGRPEQFAEQQANSQG